MGDLVQSASSILSGAQRRAEDAAHNITNMSTPGYRAKHSFAEALQGAAGPGSGYLTRTSPTAGLLSETGNPYDLAIAGEGFFELRGDGPSVYTRNGQFTRDGDGRLLGAGGRALQGVGGGDIILPSPEAVIRADGTVMDRNQVLGQIALVQLEPAQAIEGPDGTLASRGDAPILVESGVMRQGFLEGSNVSLGDEMIAMMEAVRRAETGQKLMNVYDDLMGRVVTTLGQAS